MKTLGNAKGFTLIELIVIIIILGILSAVAVPKYIDMKQAAGKGVANGILGSLRSAATMLYAKNVMSGSGTFTIGSLTDSVQVDGATVAWGTNTVLIEGKTYTFTMTPATCNPTDTAPPTIAMSN